MFQRVKVLGFRGSPTWITSLILLIIITSCSFTETASNHGLHWGFGIGDKFRYHSTDEYPSDNESRPFDYYVIVEDLPAIPKNASEVQRIIATPHNEWSAHFSFFDIENQEITPPYSYLIMRPILLSAFPLGNLSLVEEVTLAGINMTHYDVEIVETEIEWGLILHSEGYLCNNSDTWMYSKEDGVLNSLQYETRYDDGDNSTFRIERLDDYPLQSVIFGLSVVSIGLFAVVFILFWKGIRRGK
jgi:hypothetical protein